MGAITVKEFSAPAELTEVPDPQREPGQVLIPVEAAGVNPMDRSSPTPGARRWDRRNSDDTVPGSHDLTA